MIWAKNENLYADEFIEHTLLILTELLLNRKKFTNKAFTWRNRTLNIYQKVDSIFICHLVLIIYRYF